MNSPTGLERITTLEVELRQLRITVEDSADRLKSVESLLLQGRGAMRLVHWMLGAAALLGAGWAGHAKMTDFLKWLGS